MKYAACLLVAGAMLTPSADLTVNGKRIPYPVAKKGNVVDDYSGVKIPDPYRWLEDTNSPETAAWVEAENKVTQAYLAQIPERDKIRKRLTELFDYERYPALALDQYAGAFQAGGRHFIFRNSGLQNQYVLYVLDKPAGEERVLLDPNLLRADGTAALNALSVDHSGKLLAYSISQAGSDWSEFHVRDIATARDLADHLQWTKFTNAAWTHDGRAFYYQRYPEPDSKKALTASNQNAKLFLHRVGDPQSADKLVYERPDQPKWIYGPQVSEDGHYLVISIFGGDESWNLLFYQDLESARPKIIELIGQPKAKYNFLGNDGSKFYIHTTDSASKGRIIFIDVNHPDPGNWKEIVPQQSETLESAQLVGGKLILSYLKDAHAQLKVAGLDGKIQREVTLPGLGTVDMSPAYSTDTEIFYSFTSYTSPSVIYRYDLRSDQSTVYRRSKLSFDPSQYEAEQVFYPSKDGARVPMFLVHRKGLKRDGQNPALLYGYGGFNIAMTPAFNPAFLGWMEMGGLLAVANLRGGSEYGEAWHQAGTKLHKQNVFDDFIAAAEWLIANQYTSTPRLAIHGGSNGGLLIGAVLNQRPDLFGAALPAVGVMDMLRFNQFTIGAAWEGDYGSPQHPEEFEALRSYSPLHNIRPGVHYPPALITTSDHDDRVVPGHSFKYAATLQAAQGGPAPALIRIETRAGHGAGKPTTKIIEEYADRFAFLVRELHMKL